MKKIMVTQHAHAKVVTRQHLTAGDVHNRSWSPFAPQRLRYGLHISIQQTSACQPLPSRPTGQSCTNAPPCCMQSNTKIEYSSFQRRKGSLTLKYQRILTQGMGHIGIERVFLAALKYGDLLRHAIDPTTKISCTQSRKRLVALH